MAAQRYNYVQLAEAAERQGVCNLWAVVSECSVPRPTRGTDLVCNLTLVDPSTADHPELGAGVEMLCFAAHAHELPKLRRPGDIIRLHRVKVNTYNDKPQLVGKVGYRGAGFAFCLFDREQGAPGGAQQHQHQHQHQHQQQQHQQHQHQHQQGGGGDDLAALAPYQASSAHYHFDGREGALLRALRDYLATLTRAQLGGSTAYLRRISGVRPGQFFDVLARVVAVDDSHPRLRLLFLWDGSDALPLPASYDTRDSEDAPPEAAQLLPLLRPFALPLEHMSAQLRGSVPALGTALPMLFPKAGRVEGPPLGAWVKLRNLGARVVQGQLQAFFHRSSRWTPWADDGERAALEAEYARRLAGNHVAGWAPATRGELLALCSHAERPVSTLRQVLLDTPAATPRSYRVLVRLADFAPREPGQVAHPAAQCGLLDNGSGSGGGGRWVYTLHLVLEDATAQLDALLFGPDAEAFFADLPARDFGADPAAAAEVQRRLHTLLGVGCQRDGGPWMELCLKSYFQDPAAPWQSRQYRVYAAALQLAAPPPAGGA